MQIVATDYELSGINSLSLRRSVELLLGLDAGMRVSKLEVVLHDDERIAAERPNPSLSRNCDLANRVELSIEIDSVPTRVLVRLFREKPGPHSGTIVGGMLDLTQVLSETEQPSDALRRLASAVTRVAELLRVAFLVVADEDDASLQIQPGDLRLPSLFGVYQEALLNEILDRLPSVGAVVEATHDASYRLIWVGSPEVLLAGDTRSRDVLELLRQQLMTNPLPWSPLCRRFL